MNPDRFFDPDPTQRAIARDLYEPSCRSAVDLPARPRRSAPVCRSRLFVWLAGRSVDHSRSLRLSFAVFKRHFAGITRRAPRRREGAGREVETDHRKIWQTFADHFYLFRGTPTGVWLNDELANIFGVEEKLTSESAQRIYDCLEERLAAPEFKPRALFERFNIETLCTTDAATDPLTHHQALKASGWTGNIRPTFRPDGVINLDAPGWRANIDALSAVSGIEVRDYASYIRALENRRAFFKSLGATATDHAALTPFTEELSAGEADTIFRHALNGQATTDDATRFTGHMLMEMARMSIDDGLTMQLHPGSLRNHNDVIFERFGLDKGADIPIGTEYTRNLRPLLNKYGNDPRLTLILFTLDEVSLLTRTRAAGRALSRAAPRPAVVVLRQSQRHGALLRSGHGDGGAVQHVRLQRRHARVPVDPGAARRVAARRRELAGGPCGTARHRSE